MGRFYPDLPGLFKKRANPGEKIGIVIDKQDGYHRASSEKTA